MGPTDPSGITPQRGDARRSARGSAADAPQPEIDRRDVAGKIGLGGESGSASGDETAQSNGPAASKGGAARIRSSGPPHAGPGATEARASEARAAVRQSDRHVEWIRSAVAQYERPLTQYATHLLAGDLDRARDLVQEAFLRLCDQEKDAIEGHVVEWLYTVCRNLAIDVKRKERRMRLITEEQQDSFAATYESPTDAAERVDAFGRVSEVIQSLPPRQQEIVRLKFQHGMSYKEIGQVLNLTATNVGFILHTAIKSLREHLGSDLTRSD